MKTTREMTRALSQITTETTVGMDEDGAAAVLAAALAFVATLANLTCNEWRLALTLARDCYAAQQ